MATIALNQNVGMKCRFLFISQKLKHLEQIRHGLKCSLGQVHSAQNFSDASNKPFFVTATKLVILRKFGSFLLLS